MLRYPSSVRWFQIAAVFVFLAAARAHACCPIGDWQISTMDEDAFNEIRNAKRGRGGKLFVAAAILSAGALFVREARRAKRMEKARRMADGGEKPAEPRT